MKAGKVHIGTSGWNYKHWKKTFYPEDIPKKDWLDYYSKQFKTVEVNNTFYRMPKKDTLEKWHDKTPTDFIFTLKASRIITHSKKLKNAKENVERFYQFGESLKGKLGCYLFQLPPNFTYNEDNLKRLESFVKILDSRKHNVIEFRDKKWWNEDVYELLKKNKVIFCSVSGLKMPEKLIKTADTIYFRLHGKDYASKYTSNKLKKFMEQIKDLKAKEVFIYFNNDAQGFAPKNANQMIEMI